LEVKEGVLMADPEASVAKLTALRGLGVGVALDDFGAAYSSLTQLGRLPLDLLQLNHSLVARLGNEPEDDAVVAAMIDFSHAVGWKVVGQGVEGPNQVAKLGCDLLQGRHLAVPGATQEAAQIVVAKTRAP
jgi:EAL domain-containing protein (putative c-di-GMP-specific phosphodiesterase class I)